MLHIEFKASAPNIFMGEEFLKNFICISMLQT